MAHRFIFGANLVFVLDTARGKTRGLRCQTPIVHRPGQRQSISAVSTVGPRGEFCTYVGGLSGELSVELLGQLMHWRKNPVRLILDSLRVHKSTSRS